MVYVIEIFLIRKTNKIYFRQFEIVLKKKNIFLEVDSSCAGGINLSMVL